MKPLVAVLLLFFVGTALCSCAQTKSLVVNKSGYFVVPSTGTIPMENDQELQPNPDSVFLLFVETLPGVIQWERAWKSGRSFSVIPQETKRAKVIVGTPKEGSGKVELSPAKGNTLWQLELSDDQQKSKAPQPVSTNEVLLKGFEKGKVFYVRIRPLTELASPRYQ